MTFVFFVGEPGYAFNRNSQISAEKLYQNNTFYMNLASKLTPIDESIFSLNGSDPESDIDPRLRNFTWYEIDPGVFIVNDEIIANIQAAFDHFDEFNEAVAEIEQRIPPSEERFSAIIDAIVTILEDIFERNEQQDFITPMTFGAEPPELLKFIVEIILPGSLADFSQTGLEKDYNEILKEGNVLIPLITTIEGEEKEEIEVLVSHEKMHAKINLLERQEKTQAKRFEAAFDNIIAFSKIIKVDSGSLFDALMSQISHKYPELSYGEFWTQLTDERNKFKSEPSGNLLADLENYIRNFARVTDEEAEASPDGTTRARQVEFTIKVFLFKVYQEAFARSNYDLIADINLTYKEAKQLRREAIQSAGEILKKIEGFDPETDGRLTPPFIRNQLLYLSAA